MAFNLKTEFLLDWKYDNFFDPTPNTLVFTCKGCGEDVDRWQRESHFKEHVNSRDMIHQAAIVASKIGKKDVNDGAPRVLVCRTCTTSFEIERKRGRPPVNCPKCREKEGK